jgi:hypothetical protein
MLPSAKSKVRYIGVLDEVTVTNALLGNRGIASSKAARLNTEIVKALLPWINVLKPRANYPVPSPQRALGDQIGSVGDGI